ncbi:coenzyme PQQ synthesis protein PqqA [Caballeronia calidae]|uniref:Coenzyme PQQ synthesis protein A n=2 Tax=Caballeronia TaxID=1827195 RepID=A0A158A3B4_9BURK|nr:coenzyme PQQ synthesis protein PqqA [Caballeronia calidae]
MNAGAISNHAPGVLALAFKLRRIGMRGFARRLQEMKPRSGPASVWPITKGGSMKWETPSFTDMRFGFEITMYIATR